MVEILKTFTHNQTGLLKVNNDNNEGCGSVTHTNFKNYDNERNYFNARRRTSKAL